MVGFAVPAMLAGGERRMSCLAVFPHGLARFSTHDRRRDPTVSILIPHDGNFGSRSVVYGSDYPILYSEASSGVGRGWTLMNSSESSFPSG